MSKSRRAAYVFLMALGFSLSAVGMVGLVAQVTVNGITPGDTWRTSVVSGEVEVMHAWGRTAAMPVKDAWVNIDGDDISVGARCEDPIIDGKPRKDYWMPYMMGKIDKTFLGKYVYTITMSECLVPGEDAEIKVTKTAMIAVKDGVPQSLIFTRMEYAAFDIPAFIEAIRKQSGVMAEREIEYLKGFDSPL